MKKLFAVLSAVAALALATPLAFAQPSGQVQSISPLTRDLGSLKTMTGQGAATVTTADQNGFNVSRIVCVYRTSTFTGSPATTFKIQNKDAASSQYYDLVTSVSLTGTGQTTATAIAAGAGLPTTNNVSAGMPIAKTWRVSATIGGISTPTVTGTIGCSVQ